MIPGLTQALARFAEQEQASPHKNQYDRGSFFYRDRLAVAATASANQVPGDFLEIGCYVGRSSVVLADLARVSERRLLCVDPWQPGTQNCKGGEYAEWLNRVRGAGVEGVIDVCRASSLSDEARQAMSRPLSFALVDGLHTYSAAKSDILAVAHARGVIVVDDVSWNAGVRRAWEEGAKELGREAWTHEAFREGYLL